MAKSKLRVTPLLRGGPYPGRRLSFGDSSFTTLWFRVGNWHGRYFSGVWFAAAKPRVKLVDGQWVSSSTET